MMPLQTAKADLGIASDAGDALVALHNRTVDALAGYAEMVEKAEPSFRSVAEEFRALHAMQADQLARMLADLGREVDADGTFMGTVNAAVVSVRAFFDTIDEGVMDNIRDGETSVLSAYEEAIATAREPASRAALVEMRAALLTLLERTSHLD